MLIPTRIAASRQVLVQEHAHVGLFEALRERAGFAPADMDIRAYGGVDALPRFLRAFLLTPGFHKNLRSLAFVCDAREDAARAFKTIQSLLLDAHAVPPAEAGQLTAGAPRIGVLVLPSSTAPGTIEDLCIEAVKDSPAMECVDAFVLALEQKGIQVTNPAKTRIHAFIAARERPGLNLGQAVAQGYIPATAPCFVPIIEFLKLM